MDTFYQSPNPSIDKIGSEPQPCDANTPYLPTMPPEVISLLSSPELSPVRVRRNPIPNPSPVLPSRPRTETRPATRTGTEFSFLTSDLNSSLYDFANFDTPAPEPASKRRRLSLTLTPTPEVEKQKHKQKRKQKDPFALLLSEDSIVSDAHGNGHGNGRYTSSTRTNVNLNFWNEISDPIVCSSSAPEPRHQKADEIGNDANVLGKKGRDVRAISVEDSPRDWKAKVLGDFEDENEPLSPPSPRPCAPGLSSRTAALLASIRDKNARVSGKGKGKGKGKTGRRSAGMSIVLTDEEHGVDVAPPEKRKSVAKSTVDKSAKALERQAAKAKKDQEKAEEKERKRRKKEEKDRQKRLAADIAEANKSKVDKKVSTPEMIIDVSTSLEDTSVGNQVGEYMKHLGVEMHFVSTQLPGIVRWRRKVNARYNEEAGHWEPCPPTIEREDHVLCFLPAQDFVNMATASLDDETLTLESHLSKLNRFFPSCKPIYLIEGLTSWLRKNQNARNRVYQAAVRRQFDSHSAEPSRKRTAQPTPSPIIDDDTIEDALLSLQVQHSALIQHTSSAPESAEWIRIFTEHISTVPYRRERMRDLHATPSFCMDVGQVRTGVDAADTYVKMLMEVQRVTGPMAYGVAAEYADVRALMDVMRRDGAMALQDVKKGVDKSGGVGEARVGPAGSRRLYKVFMGLDPGSTEI